MAEAQGQRIPRSEVSVNLPYVRLLISLWLLRLVFLFQHLRRDFMQETLNKMVASVRHGVLGPDDASRSIHECAALLGLQLATEIPVTTLIISGMRKTVTAEDLIDAFREFGEIMEAAVASNQRGFGKSVDSVSIQRLDWHSYVATPNFKVS